MEWLWFSLIASVVLTVVLNLALRVGDGGRRRGERVEGWLQDQVTDRDRADQQQVRVIVPWKAMIVVSVGLTILLNLAVWILR